VTSAAVEAAYASVYLWKLAAEKGKSADVAAVRKALAGLEFDAPGGKVKVDAKNQHTWRPFRVGKVTKDRQFEVVYEKAWLAPDPYPPPLKAPRE
jgi:urea transport system substrate-binding protein